MPRALSINLMLHAAHAVQDQLEARLNGVGLSSAKYVALKALSEAGESMPLSQLAGSLQCVKSNITQLVDRLEADGLVVRQADARDRRTRLAALTPAGREAVEAGSRVLEEAEREAFRGLTSEEAQQLEGLLKKLGPR